MNAYTIAGTVLTLAIILVTDKFRCLRDLALLVILLALHVWMGFVALIISPLAMLVMTILGPLLRGLGVASPETQVHKAMSIVMSNTLPGQKEHPDMAKAEAIIAASRQDLSAALDACVEEVKDND